MVGYAAYLCLAIELVTTACAEFIVRPRSSTATRSIDRHLAGQSPCAGIVQRTTPSEPYKLHIPNSSAEAGQGQSSRDTGLSGVTASDPAERSIQGSKQDLGDRRHAESRGSSRQSMQGDARNSEKRDRPGLVGQSRSVNNAVETRPKKRGLSRLFSLLNCCGSPNNGNGVESEEMAPRPKPTVPPAKMQRTSPPRTQEALTAATQRPEAVQSSEKKRDLPILATGMPSISTEKGPANDARMQKPVSLTTTDQPPTPIEKDFPRVLPKRRDESQSEGRMALPPLNTSFAALHSPSQSSTPIVNVQAPTPIVSQSEAGMISDRTPQQEQLDHDIEMVDAGPSIPISTNDVAPTPEEPPITQARQQRQAPPPRIDLPPPPPLSERREQTTIPEPTPPRQSTSTPIDQTPTREPQKWLLPPIRPEMRGRKCLVLDLDETLVHSSFKACAIATPFLLPEPGCLCEKWTDACFIMSQILHQADFTIPVEIEGQYHNVYVIKRPGVDDFMKRVGELYEVVVFTASVSKVCSFLCPSFHP